MYENAHESGLTVTSWCRDHDIDTKKYYYCLRKIRAAACKALPSINGEGGIVPLEIQEASISSPKDASYAPREPASADIIIRLETAVSEIHSNASASLIENAIRAPNNAR